MSDLRPSIDWPCLLRSNSGVRHELLRVGCGPALVARHCRWGMPVYLATPYSLQATGPDGCWTLEGSQRALAGAARESARLAEVGVSAVSPVVLAASMVHATLFPMRRFDPLDDRFWREWCRPILDACCAVVVPDLNGWQQSAGIWHEVMVSLDLLTPVFVYGGTD